MPASARTGRLILVSVAGLVLALAGCTHAPPAPVAPNVETKRGDDQSATGGKWTGLASYYATKFEGRRTASGALYHRDSLTAAHRTLPFGTRVRVTRLATGSSVVLVVNDRGPFRKGRIIDVSRRAAEELDLLQVGVARVQVDVLARPVAAR